MVACVACGVISEGHEAKSWEDRKATEKKKLMFVKIVLLLCTTAYLPVSRSCIEVRTIHFCLAVLECAAWLDPIMLLW